jgi:hypothetical protein
MPAVDPLLIVVLATVSFIAFMALIGFLFGPRS